MLEIIIGLIFALAVFLFWPRRRRLDDGRDQVANSEQRHSTKNEQDELPSVGSAHESEDVLGNKSVNHAHAAEESTPIDDLICEITYQNDKGEISNRTIRPTSLKSGPYSPMLYAYCENARAFRTFRTDRITEVIDHDGEILDIETYMLRHANIDIGSIPRVPGQRHPGRRKVSIKPAEIATTTDSNALAGEVIVFTGKLESYTRAEAQEIARNLGAEVMGNVTKRTTLVVAAEGAGFRLETARKREVRIISEDEWKSMISEDRD